MRDVEVGSIVTYRTYFGHARTVEVTETGYDLTERWFSGYLLDESGNRIDSAFAPKQVWGYYSQLCDEEVV